MQTCMHACTHILVSIANGFLRLGGCVGRLGVWVVNACTNTWKCPQWPIRNSQLSRYKFKPLHNQKHHLLEYFYFFVSFGSDNTSPAITVSDIFVHYLLV